MKSSAILFLMLTAGALLTGAAEILPQLRPDEWRAAGIEGLSADQRVALERALQRVWVTGRPSEAPLRSGGASGKRAPRWLHALVTLKKAEAKPEAEEAIESRLVGSVKNFSGRRSFTLENGQVWQMSEADSYAGPSYERPLVRVWPGLFGTFWLQIPEAAIRVKVKPVKLE